MEKQITFESAHAGALELKPAVGGLAVYLTFIAKMSRGAAKAMDAEYAVYGTDSLPKPGWTKMDSDFMARNVGLTFDVKSIGKGPKAFHLELNCPLVDKFVFVRIGGKKKGKGTYVACKARALVDGRYQDVLEFLIASGSADGVEDDAGAFVAVHGVGFGFDAELLFIGFVKFFAFAGEHLRWESAEGDVGAAFERVFAGSFDEGVLAATVGADELDVESGGFEVFGDLAAVGLRRAAEVNHLGAGAFDFGGERTIVRGFGVNAFVAGYHKAVLGGDAFENVGETFAVEFAVVEDENFFRAKFFRPERGDFALDVVGGNDAEIIYLAGGTIHGRFVRLAEMRFSEAGISIRGADHREVGLVQDWHRDLGGAGVVGADVRDDVVVAHGFLRVGGFDGRVPLAAFGRGVIPIFVGDLVAGNGAANFFDGELDAVDDAAALRVGAAGAREAGNDFDLVGVGDSGGEKQGEGGCLHSGILLPVSPLASEMVLC